MCVKERPMKVKVDIVGIYSHLRGKNAYENLCWNTLFIEYEKRGYQCKVKFEREQKRCLQTSAKPLWSDSKRVSVTKKNRKCWFGLHCTFWCLNKWTYLCAKNKISAWKMYRRRNKKLLPLSGPNLFWKSSYLSTTKCVRICLWALAVCTW